MDVKPIRSKSFEAEALSKTLEQWVDIYTVDERNLRSGLVKRSDAPLTMLDGLQAADCWQSRGYCVEIRIVSQPSH
jgi:hypothetical protein